MKNLRRQKTKENFINVAIEIIKQKGVGGLTARLVAEKAGYNVASIYNYFKNLDYLENLASIHFTKDYANELTSKTYMIQNGLEIYIIMWELFLKHAFKDPYLYYNVFYSATTQAKDVNLFKEYYDIYQEEKPTDGGYILGMMEIDNTYNRGLYVLEQCCEEGSINCDMKEYINDIHIGYTSHIFTSMVKTKTLIPTEKLFNETMRYIIYSMYHFIPDNFKNIADTKLNNYI